jgi:HSP20 family protein
MSRDLARLMQALFLPTAAGSPAPWAPAADVYRTTSGWLVKLDLAGMRPDDIDVEVVGCQLTIRGTRRDCLIQEESRCHQMEIAYGPFERIVQLPCDLGRAPITCDYRDGMLIVRIGQKEE